MQETDSLCELLRHDDFQVRRQGLALLRALPPREAGEVLSKLALWKELPLEGMALQGVTLRAGCVESCALQGCRLEPALFRDTPLSYSALHASHLRGAILDGVRAVQIGFCNADLTKARFRKGVWNHVHAGRARMDELRAMGWVARDSTFCLASMCEAYFLRCKLVRVDLRGADLRGASLIRTQVRGADLRGADLRGALLQSCILSDIDLRGAVLQDVDWSECKVSGVLVDSTTEGEIPPGAWRLCPGANLQGWEGEGVDLEGADLHGADLSRVDLRGANLRRVVFAGAQMRCANLEEADLRGADLRETDLSGAMLGGANLLNADLRGACLVGAQVAGALCDDTTRWPGPVPAGVIRLVAGMHLESLRLSDVDLSGIDLQNARIEDLHMEDVSLRDAKLTGFTSGLAWLRRVDLRGVDMAALTGRDIHLLEVIQDGESKKAPELRPRSARLRQFLADQGLDPRPIPKFAYCDLRDADLRGQDLRDAKLAGADLRGVDLRGADLTRADMWGALIDAQTQADDREELRRSGAIEVPPGWRWAWRPLRLSPAPLAQAPAWAEDSAFIPLLPGMRIWVESVEGWLRTWHPPIRPQSLVLTHPPGVRRCVPDLGDKETFAMAATWLVLENVAEPSSIQEPVTVERVRKGWQLVTKEEVFHFSLDLCAAPSLEQALAATWRRHRESPGAAPDGERYTSMGNPPLPDWLGLSGRAGQVARHREQEQERHQNRQHRWLQRLLQRFETGIF